MSSSPYVVTLPILIAVSPATFPSILIASRISEIVFPPKHDVHSCLHIFPQGIPFGQDILSKVSQDGKFQFIYQNAVKLPHPPATSRVQRVTNGCDLLSPILDIWYLQISLFIKSFLCQHTILHLPLLTQECHLPQFFFILHTYVSSPLGHSHQHEKVQLFLLQLLKKKALLT